MDDRENKTLAILAGWKVLVKDKKSYISSMHYLYLVQMARLFNRVILMAPLRSAESEEEICSLSLIEIDRLEICPLPYFNRHVDALRYWREYSRAINKVAQEADMFYCRVPDPFCWMPAQKTDKPVVMHFVGDTEEVTKNNIGFSIWKKAFLLAGYKLEYRQILKSASRSKVYTNGSHLSEKLRKQGIIAESVISSTITIDDLPKLPLHSLSTTPLTLVFVGYLRYAKGIDTLVEVLKILDSKEFDYEMHVVGDGEMMPQLQQYLKSQDTPRLVLHGHVNDRPTLLSILRNSDLFFFPSLSEGSPRVVIEAMSQGCAVLSTPVGSLPTCFKEEEEIYFFPFSDANVAASKIMHLGDNISRLESVRDMAYARVCKDFLMEQFISKITQI